MSSTRKELCAAAIKKKGRDVMYPKDTVDQSQLKKYPPTKLTHGLENQIFQTNPERVSHGPVLADDPFLNLWQQNLHK